MPPDAGPMDRIAGTEKAAGFHACASPAATMAFQSRRVDMFPLM